MLTSVVEFSRSKYATAMASDSVSSVRATASARVLGRFCLTLNATCVSDNCSK